MLQCFCISLINHKGSFHQQVTEITGNYFYHSYYVCYILVAINQYTAGVERTDGDLWQEDSSVEVSWDSDSIGGLDDDVSIDLARYKMNDDDTPVLDSFHTVVDSQPNNGHSQFIVTQGEGDG